MLHIVNKSPFTANSLDTCLRVARAGSVILLIEDGVYAAQRGTSVSDHVAAALGENTVYALEGDVQARGVADKLLEGIQLVDYGGFVDLVAGHDRVQSWL